MENLKLKLHRYQALMARNHSRFQVAACGRRFGKSRYAWVKIFRTALKKKGRYAWIVPWYKTLYPVSEIIRETIPKEFFTKRLEQGPVIRYLLFPNGSEVHFLSADTEDSLRGPGWDGAVLDEAPQIKESRWIEEIRPSLMDKGGWALFIGTPKGVGNWFYKLYIHGQDKSQTKWRSWNFPTSTNPYIPKEEIETTKNELPEIIYRQELLATFEEGSGTIFRNADAAVAGSLGEVEVGRRYVIGVDLAKTQDFTVMVVIDDLGHVRQIDRFNQLDWVFQKSRIKNLTSQYSGTVIIDSSGLGDPIYDDLSRDGLRIFPFKFTSESKKQLIENLSMKLDRNELTIPHDCEQLLNELKAFSYEMSPQGNIKYGAPEGLHDDCVIALALAAFAALAQELRMVSIAATGMVLQMV